MGSMFLHCVVLRVQTEGKALFTIIYLCHEYQLYANMFSVMWVPMCTVFLSSSDFSIWVVIVQSGGSYEEKRGSYGPLVWESEGKGPLGRLRNRRQCNIEVCLKEWVRRPGLDYA